MLHDSYILEPGYGDGIYRYFNKQQIDANNWKSLKGFIHGFVFETGLDSAIKLKTDIELELLTKQRNEWEQRGRDVSYEFEKMKSQLQGWKQDFTLNLEKWQQDQGEQLEVLKTTKELEINTIAKEKKEGLENLEKTYRNWIQIEAPVRYWKIRARNYRKRGWSWMALTVVFTLFVVEPLLYILYRTLDSFHSMLLRGDPIAIKSLIVFALIVSFLTYLIRIASRMTLSSFHIERDAEEREQLTYVYLALSKEGKIDDKDKTIILQSLFSRVDTGILKEDSAPTMPGIGSVVERFIKK